MYKESLALNNLKWLICHKTQPDPTKNPVLEISGSLWPGVEVPVRISSVGQLDMFKIHCYSIEPSEKICKKSLQK